MSQITMSQTKMREIMHEKGITHQVLHDITDELFITPVGMDRISKMATGKLINVSVHTLLKIAYALNVSINELVEEEYFIETEMRPEMKKTIAE